MKNQITNDARMAKQEVNSFYNSIRAAGALKMANQLTQSLDQQASIMKNLNDQMVKPYQVIAKNALRSPIVPKSVLSSLAKTNSTLSGIPTKQLSQMIPYKFQTNPGFFKQIAEQQAAFAKKMSSWTKFAQKAQKELDQKYRTLIPVINLLSKNGWVITPFFEIDKLFMLRGKSTSYCIQFMTDYYSKEDHKQFFYEFDQLLKDFIDEDFDDGYLDQLQRMRKLVQSDFKNSDVLINTAVSILEFKYIEVMGFVSTGNTLRQKDINDYFKHHENDRRSIFDYLSFCSLLKTLSKFMGYENFNVGVENTHLTRHAIQHGRYDPSRYKDTDFIKVILLIIATRFCTDIYQLD